MTSKSAKSNGKRCDRSLEEKMEILEKYDKLQKTSQRNAAIILGVTQPTLCKLLRMREEIECEAASERSNSRKRRRHGKDREVEEALKQWFTYALSNDCPVNGPLLMKQANKLAQKLGKNEFKATEGWFHRWKKRENVVFRKVHGEQGDTEFPATDSTESWLREVWPNLLAEYGFENVYKVDGTGLYYRVLPETSYTLKEEDNAEGRKTSEDRVTVLCCMNMAGEKERLLVIGKSEKPRCFKNVHTLPVDYYANENAWMTMAIFKHWLQKWDRRLRRNVLLLADTSAAHVVDFPLQYIKVVFLPTNTTSIIQPCDRGVIKTMKSYYRILMGRAILEAIDDQSKHTAAELSRKTDLLSAIHFLANAWREVTSTTIRNYFRHSGFSIEIYDFGEDSTEPEFELPSGMTAKTFNEWVAVDDNVSTIAPITENDICQKILDTRANGVQDDFEEEEEYEPSVRPPSNEDITAALAVLRRAVQCRGSDELFASHYNYEKLIHNLITFVPTEIEIGDHFS